MKYKTTSKQRENALNYYYKNKKKRLEYANKYRRENKDKIRVLNKNYQRKNSKKEKIWGKRTREKFKKIHGISYASYYEKKRCKTDKVYRKKRFNYKSLVRRNRNIKSIEKAENHKQLWSIEDEQFLIKNIKKLYHIDIAECLGRSLFSIKSKVRKLRIKGLV